MVSNFVFLSQILIYIYFQANENSIEHEYSLRTLERRWQELYKQIIDAEQDTQQSVITSKFEDEYQTLSKAINEYKAWIDSSLSTSSKTEMQVDKIERNHNLLLVII